MLPGAITPSRVGGLSTSAGFQARHARGSQSDNPTVTRGLSTSTGFAMLSLGMTLSAAVFAMGTVDMLDELSKLDGSLSAALAKLSTVDPKSQAEAYNLDKSGWMASEDKELKNHAENGSWEYIDASELPRGWSNSCGSTRSSATAHSNPGYACKAAAKCPASTTIKPGAAPCAAPRYASSPISPPTRA